jgi:hypothetical protein
LVVAEVGRIGQSDGKNGEENTPQTTANLSGAIEINKLFYCL